VDQLAVVIVDPFIVEKDRLVAVGAIGLVGLAVPTSWGDAVTVQDVTALGGHAVVEIDGVVVEPAAADALTPVIAVGRGDTSVTSDTFFSIRIKIGLRYARQRCLRCLRCQLLAVSAGFRRDTLGGHLIF
jgi:hypothetical protein